MLDQPGFHSVQQSREGGISAFFTDRLGIETCKHIVNKNKIVENIHFTSV
jgi:hypothetical protein